MYYPSVIEDGNTRAVVDTWLGYNHNYRISAGEFYDMENISSDAYPVMTARQKRVLLKSNKNKTIRGMIFTEDNLCYLEDSVLHYSTKELDLGIDITEDQTLLRFGAYVLIYPLGIYVNVEKSPMEAAYMAQTLTLPGNTKVKFSICKVDGSDYENISIGPEAPENPADGQYWVCTLTSEPGLNMYYKTTSSWQPVATTYLRIEAQGAKFADQFAEGDAVYMNFPATASAFGGLDVSLINNGSILQKVANDYIVVQGILTNGQAYTEYTTSGNAGYQTKFERRIPKLDYVCTNKNRVWGCHYGYEDGEVINEIYCTKLGDFRNWYVYQGLATDSYSATIGTPGKWTGCISYQGYPTFFKENAIVRVYGSYPAEYTVDQKDARGVQDGSYRSLAIVSDTLFYKAGINAVMAYDGSLPVMISANLGKGQYYYDAVSGVVDGKYHLVVQDVFGHYKYFVYDSAAGIWTKENELEAKWFSWSLSGHLYAATANEIYGLGSTDNVAYTNKLVGEEFVSWWAQTGEYGFEYSDFKYVSKITLRAYVPYLSEISVQISYDDRPFEDVGIIRGNDEIMSQALSIIPYRCDHYRLKFSGHGPVRIYSMTTTLEVGSEENAYTYR